ncbi:MAG: efflux RND transporter periplasmic adaptor subunit [Pseudomonadota bacterium]
MKHTELLCKLTAGLSLSLLLAPVLAFAEDPETIPVTVTEVVAEDLSPLVPAAGTVYSRKATQITAGLAGRIEWIAEPGDRIEAGAAVAIFDCEMLELRRDEQLAEADRAAINHATLDRETERLETLRASLVAAETQLSRMQGDRDLAASDLRIARLRTRQTEAELERCVAEAPFSGVVTEQFRNAGEDVERSTVLAAMTDTRNLEVRAAVPIRYMPRIRTGTTADISIGELRFEGYLRTAVPAGDALSQTFEVRIDLPKAAPDFIAAGQLVSVSLPLVASNVLTVPRDSVVLREEGAFVMRVNGDNRVERVKIEVADGTGRRVAVRGALQPGDRIAVRGAEALDDGEAVVVHTDG